MSGARVPEAFARWACLPGTASVPIAMTAPVRGARALDESVESLPMQWFDRLQTGAINRDELAPEYSDQLTGAEGRPVSSDVRDHAYGVPPQAAEIVSRRRTDDPTIYVVKLIFPRGDCASLLIGLKATGDTARIGGISVAGG